ncbi:MAG: lamin tail domain-containing protein [Verrucomicrobiia bacterium]
MIRALVSLKLLLVVFILAVPFIVYGQPANDNFENRIMLGGYNITTTGSNAGATKETGEPDRVGGARYGATVWWGWVAPASGLVTIDTVGSSFNTVLGVYTGTLGSLTVVAENNDIGGGTNQSRVTFNAVAGTEYKILVGGTRIFGSIYYTGSIILRISMAISIILTSPTNGDVYVYGAPITVSATVSGGITNIQRIEFYRTTTLIATLTNQPYTTVVTNTPLGQHSFYAVMVYTGNARATSSVATITVLEPGITITSPADGATFTDTNAITINAIALIPSGSMTNVSFYVNGNFIATGISAINQSTYSATWNNVVPGVHRILAVGWADSGTIFTSAPVYIAVAYKLIPSNSVWKYLDDGTDQGTAWRNLDFDDSQWAEGMAELGYGDATNSRPENTLLNYGPDPNNKYITYYFRKKIIIPDPQSYTNFVIRIMRDDGAVVYINGTEVGRFNLPAGNITYSTLANNAADDGTVFYPATVPVSVILPGTNIIAVEIHQSSLNSSDISFDFELLGIPVIIRNQNPVLNITSPANNSYYFAPQLIRLKADAYDPDGDISRVDFYVDGKIIGSVSNAPYELDWQNPTLGKHTIQILAIDNMNGVSSATISVIVYDAVGTPFVTVTAPKDGTVYSNLTWYTNVTISADVLSAFVITKMQFFANGLLIGTDTTSPYSIVWNNAAFGTNLIVATAETDSGLVGTSAPVKVVLIEPPYNTNPPVIANVSPAKGLIISTLTNIQVTFSENVIGVDASDLLVNGVPATSVSGSGSNYTFVVVQPPYGTVNVSWAANHGITDIGYPANLPFDETAPGATWTYQLVDLIPPIVVSQTPPAGSTVSSLSQITVVFSEPVTNVDASDLLINNSPAITLRGGGTTYTFGFPQPSPGTVNITWSPNHGITDLAASPNPFNHTAAGSTWSYLLDPRYVLIESNSVWKFKKGTNEVSTPMNAWRFLDYDDSGWSNALAPFFFGDTGYTNAQNPGTLLSDMQSNYTCIFLRKQFFIPNLSAVTNLYLNAQSDDGFIAWINGVEVLRYNMPSGEIAYNGVASSSAPEPNNNGAAWLSYTINNLSSYLREGTNVFTVQAFNVDLSNSSDFGFNAQLYTYLLTPESVPPRIASINPQAGVVYQLNSIQVAFTEPVTNVDASDLLINGVPAQSVTASASNTVYTFQFAQPPYGTVNITWATNHNIVDLDPVPKAFDATALGATWQYTLLNPNAPAIVNQTPLAGSTVTQLTSITITFNKPVAGINASDLLINGSPATNMQGSNATFTFFFPQPAYGNVSIGWAANHGITDLSQPPNEFNPYQPGNVWSYKLVDKMPPYIVNVVPAPGSTVSNLTTIIIQFSEPVKNVDRTDLLINGVPAQNLAIIGSYYRFTFPTPNASIIRITWSPYTDITDLAEEPNPFDITAPGATWVYYAFDNMPPKVKSIDPPPGVALTELSQISITFDEEVMNVSADDLLINSRPARAVTGSGAGPYIFTFAPVLSGTVEVRWSPEQDITDFANPPNKFSNGEWTYYIAQNVSYAGKIIINEIMFNPISGNPADEWIELYNTTTNVINLNGFKFTRGVNYIFPNVSIPGRGFLVVAADVNKFKSNYPGITNVVGGWTGSLANSDETIELTSPTGESVNQVHYASEGTWAQRVRGSGAQLVQSITRSGSTATVTIQGHGYQSGDAVIIMGADQPEYNGRFTINSVATSTFTITVSGTPATPATGRILCFRITDRGFSGLGWFCEADGFGSSLELINPALPNTYGQNWSSSAVLYGTPGGPNSVSRENIAPLITDVTHYPPIPRSTNSIIITAKVIDEIPGGVQNVTLFYRNHTTQNPPAFSPVQMFDDGQHQDGLPGDGIYGAVLPPMANGTIIEFYVQASDINGNSRTYPGPVLETNGPNNTFGTAIQSANALFQVDDEVISNTMPSVRLVMTATDRATFPPSNRNSDAEFNCTMIATDGGGTAVRYSCGVRVRGAGTRSRTPTNNRLNIPNDNRWNNLAAVNINSQFIHASLVGNVLAQKSGLPSADAHVIQYRINGVNLAPLTAPQNGTGSGAGWGTFIMLKPVNGDLFDALYPDDPGGNVYRASTGNHNANLTYYDNNPTTYISRGYYKTSNQSENDWSDLFNLVYSFSNVPNEPDYLQAIQTNVNVTYWMRYFAIGTLMNFGETALFNGIGDDYALYRGLKDKRFVLIGHDYDTIFGEGDTGSGYYPINTNSSIYIMMNPPNPNANVPVLRRFVTNAAFVPLFFGELKRLCDSTFHPNQLNPLFDQLLKGWGIGPDDTRINNMKTWAYNRRAIVLSQIPLDLTVSNTLSQQSGYYRSTSPNVTLFGTANAIHTRKVLVNGVQSIWSAWEACWTNTVTLNPGLNRVLIESVNSNNVVFASTNLDIWYDSGTTRSVSGAITTDTVWSPANGPYQVTGSITVNSGATLTIQPGTTVYMGSGVAITVANGGRLIAEGTPTAMIRFTRAPGTTTTWSGITINGGAGSPETRIAYAIIEYNSSTAIHSSGGTLYLDHVIFNTTSAQYLSLDNSSFYVSYCHFPTPTAAFEPIHGSGGIKAGGRGIFYRNYVGSPNGYNDAIDFTGGNRPNQPIVQFIENVFMGSADDILDLDGTDAWVEGNIFLHCHRNGAPDTSSAVSGGSDSGNTSEITIIRNIFYDCDHAAMAKQGNFYTFINNTVVRITHTGGTDTDSAVIAVADEGYPEAAGAYLEGNIIYDANKLVQFLTNAIVTITNNLMPFSWNGRGGSNFNANPMFKYIPQLSETYFTNWAQAQIMWDWFGLKSGSPATGAGPFKSDLGAVIPKGVRLSGVPAGSSSLGSLILNVGINRSGNGIPSSSWQYGSGYTHYKWRLDNGPWSPEIPITTPIQILNLLDGPHYIEIVGKNDAGYYQDDPIYGESATITRTPVWETKLRLPPVRLTEILAANQTVLLTNGITPDLVELYNESDEPFDLVGIRLTDDPTNPDKFIFPTNSIIPPRGYVVVYCANKPQGASGYYTGFGLNQEGDDLYLYDSRERGGALIESISFGPQIPDLSIGKLPNGSWTLTTPTFGAENRPAQIGSPYNLKINEWLALGEAPFANDFVEIYNADPLPVNIGGLYISDSVISSPTRHQFPPLSFISGYGFLRFFADGDTSQGPLHLNFRLSSFQGGIGLFDTNLVAIDIVMYQPQWKNVSQGRSPNGGSNIVYFTQPTPGSPNPIITTSITGGALVINEALAINTALAELDGSTPDWIELYNGTTNTIDLSDYSLSDDTQNPRRFVFAAGTKIDPGQFLRILCDNNKPSSTNNTGFALKGTGGSIYLFDKPSNGGSLLDSITYGIQTANFSIGRVPDGSTNWVLTTPTPQAPNAAIPNLASPQSLKINEWMAAPKAGDDWFEIYNPSAQPVAIGGLYLTDDLTRRQKHLIAPLSFIGAKSYQVFAADNNTGAGADHVNFALSASGEAVGLFYPDGTVIDAVVFGQQSVDVSEGRFPDGGTNIVKFPLTASPGEPNYRMLTNVVINEVLTRTTAPFEDAIELYNLTDQPLDISGWWLSDDFATLEKYQFPTPTIIPPKGYFVVYAQQFTNRQFAAIPFALNANGDEVVLSESANGALTGWRTYAKFGTADQNVSFGRYITSDGRAEFVAMSARTFGKDDPTSVEEFRTGTGAQNASPLVGPVVISEIMYHPPDIGTNDNVAFEYIELRNITTAPVALYDPNYPTNTWRIRDAVKYDFPAGTVLQPYEEILVVSFDPINNPSLLRDFKQYYKIDSGVRIFGPYSGKLSNKDADIELERPFTPTTNNVPYIRVEHVHYYDSAPWDSGADGTGLSLNRIYYNAYGNDPINWTASPPSPGPQPLPLDFDRDGIPDNWELQYGLDPLSAADAQLDYDGDGYSNLQEYIAGTNPLDAKSVLQFESNTIQLSGTNLLINITAAANRSYTIEYITNLSDSWSPLYQIQPAPTNRTITIQIPIDAPAKFFRLRVP